MAPVFAAIAGSLRLATTPRRGDDRSPTVRTTRLRPVAGSISRCGRGISERGEIAPLVGLIHRMRIVRGIGGVDLGGSVALDERAERRVEEHRISRAGQRVPSPIQRLAEQLLDGELHVVAVGIGDDADVADDGIAVHRAEQQAAVLPGHGRDLIDLLATVE